MIVGIGTDIVSVERIREISRRHGERFADRILAPAERAEATGNVGDAAHLLARRFAAKEAFGKATGLGLRWPATLHQVMVAHDDLGRPRLAFGAELERYARTRDWTTHLSISDEREYAIAFVVIEGP